jgi:hypothetical protein
VRPRASLLFFDTVMVVQICRTCACVMEEVQLKSMEVRGVVCWCSVVLLVM